MAGKCKTRSEKWYIVVFPCSLINYSSHAFYGEHSKSARIGAKKAISFISLNGTFSHIAVFATNNYLISGDKGRQLDVAFLEGPGSLETLASAVPLTLKGEKTKGLRFESHFVFQAIVSS